MTATQIIFASLPLLFRADSFSPSYSCVQLSTPPTYLSSSARQPLSPTHLHPLQSTTDKQLDSTESTPPINNPLTSAGHSFISASSKSLGMLFYNIGGMDHKEIQALLLQAGSALVAAGDRWDTDWEAVTYAMEDASKAFYDISDVFGSANIDESLELALQFEGIGDELKEISSISGCAAIGPPSSCGNLFAIENHLMEVSKILKKNSVAATDEHMMCTLFKEVAELFRDMGGRYVDEVGQKSEVTV